MKNFQRTLILLIALVAGGLPTWAQGVIWSGPMITFSNAPGSNPTKPANQDQITGDVWITRSSLQGIFNAALESGYTHFSSPAGTAWAFGLLTNYSKLSYNNWESWFGGRGNVFSIVDQDAVLHLVNDDIYIGIKFTYWGGNGGGFAYTRTTPLGVPEPTTTALAITGLAMLALWRRK
jgi:hypothetical protein